MTPANELGWTHLSLSASGIVSWFCGVSIVPGIMQFTLIPLDLFSAAMASVNRSTALLEAAYAPEPAPALNPGRAAIFTILPLPRSRMAGRKACALLKIVLAFRFSMKSQVEGSVL